MKEALKSIGRRCGLRRASLASLRMFGERNLLALCAPKAAMRPRILCYHSVGTPEWGVNDVSPPQFRRHIEIALRSGRRFVPADQIARSGGQPGDLAITFDDGLATVATNAAPILAEYGIPWTLFVVADWAEGRHPFGDGIVLGWRELENLAQTPGVTLGSHSVTHPRFSLLSRVQAARELGESRRILRERLGLPFDTFAIPLGQSGDWTQECGRQARAAGYEVVYAQAEDTRTPGTVPRTFVSRFDRDRIFAAAIGGAFDRWEEWV
jgi:peptidoglycan/xylan/chitin deacetylase (PgdA/CDA1 family)